MDSNFCHIRHSTCELFWLAALLLLASCSSTPPSVTEELSKVDYGVLLTMPEEPILYDEQVRPVLEQCCVVCHGCTDAPCQLKLSSYEGITRGPARSGSIMAPACRAYLRPACLSMHKTTAEWRSKGFHPVLAENADTLEGRLEESVLYQLLHLKQLHPQPKLGMLPDSMDTGLNRKQVCTTREQFDNYARQHPDWRMPYAMPNLRDEEYRTLVQWLAQGVPPAAAQTPSGNSQADRAMRTIAGLRDEQLKVFPDVALVHIQTENPENDLAYTVIRNKACTDVTSMFSNERNRDTADIEHDTLTVVEGIEGSYPNFFFVVEPAELEDFTSRTMAVRTPDDYERLIGVYGVRRTSDAFWETADWFQAYYATQDPLLYGILDLNRYANR
jgi:hypothetical protein